MKVALIVGFGVGMLWMWRRYDMRNIQEGPALTVYPSYEADISTVQNMIRAVHDLSPAPVS